MEAWKFAIYLSAPLAASAYYNNPDRMKKAAEYWQFVQYPANPVTGLREQIVKAQEQSESREEYRKQLELLHKGAVAPTTTESSDSATRETGFWRRILGLGVRKD